MENDKAIGRVRKSYAYFAENEAHGKSSLYEELATAVCSDESLIDFVVRLPIQKQQPNLVFAAVRHLFGTPENAQHFSELVKFNREPIRKLILERNTQTNEPGRCAAHLLAYACFWIATAMTMASGGLIHAREAKSTRPFSPVTPTTSPPRRPRYPK